MGERTVILVRHGQLDMKAFALDGFKAGLTPLGRRQARRTASRLRTIHVDAIHYSTLGRAAETARIMAPAFHGVRTVCWNARRLRFVLDEYCGQWNSRPIPARAEDPNAISGVRWQSRSEIIHTARFANGWPGARLFASVSS